MNTAILHKNPPRSIQSLRAKDLMTPHPISIRRDATIRQALEMLTDCGFGAAPVIDERGHPVGVISRTDILIHQRECRTHTGAARCAGSAYDCTDWDLIPEPLSSEDLSLETISPTTVSEIMTPAIFTVALDTPALEVVSRIVELKIHHLFVSNDDFAIVGVISPLDVLRCLKE
jgi:CBS domain-containing protein